MSTDAARTKLRELIATKQQWLRQWQAPELLSPGRSDMIQVLSDNIAELQQVLAELDKAEPVQERDDEVCDGLRGGLCIHQDPSQCKPERDCPAFSAPPKTEPQEPDSPERRCGGPGCDMKCCQPVQEPIKLRPLAPLTGYYDVGGKRVWLEKDEPFPQPTPPQRKPLSEEEIFKIENDIPDDVIGDRAWTICFARAVERAHGIGGEA